MARWWEGPLGLLPRVEDFRGILVHFTGVRHLWPRDEVLDVERRDPHVSEYLDLRGRTSANSERPAQGSISLLLSRSFVDIRELLAAR